jgi:hypothetical protein
MHFCGSKVYSEFKFRCKGVRKMGKRKAIEIFLYRDFFPLVERRGTQIGSRSVSQTKHLAIRYEQSSAPCVRTSCTL